MSDTNQLVIAASNGNEAAFNFMKRFLELAHMVDDVVDGEITQKEKIVKVFMEVAHFYSTDPFYLQHRVLLYPIVMTTLDAYANSVMWEGAAEDGAWKRLSEVLSGCGTMMLNFVALLTHGSVDGMRNLSPQFALDSWATHHDEKGNRI